MLLVGMRKGPRTPQQRRYTVKEAMEMIMLIMKKCVKLIAVIFVLLPSLAYSAGDDWENYLKLKERYYYLDKQQFDEISCVIEVPLMANLIEQIKKQIAPLNGKVDIRENLSSFVLTYSPKSGLCFSDPEFDIILKEKEGIADPEKVENGIGMMKNGFKMQVDGVKNVLTGIFDDYCYPQKEKYKDLVVTENNGRFIVKYIREKSNVTENYLGNTIETSQDGIVAKINATQQYLATSDNKLILKEESVLITQPAGTIKTDFKIEYQEVENIVFPKNIKAIFEQNIQTISQKGTIDISLINCQIE